MNCPQHLGPDKEPSVSLREVLLHLGFSEDWGIELTDQRPGYVFDFGNVTLSTKELHNLSMQSVFSFDGFFRDARSMVSIEFEVPIRVESVEQGTAWIVDALDRHSGFRPTPIPNWMVEGRALSFHLPWVRRQLAFSKRPMFTTDRSWVVAARTRLRDVTCLDEQATLTFDGEIVRLRGAGTSIIFAAEGRVWPAPVGFALSDFKTAISRLAGQTVRFSLWEGFLTIGQRRFCAEIL